MELDARRLYLGEGYSSLFTYCTQALHLAEGAAYNRIETARAARRFPMVLEGPGRRITDADNRPSCRFPERGYTSRMRDYATFWARGIVFRL